MEEAISYINDRLKETISKKGWGNPPIIVDFPRDERFGDLSSNLPLLLTKMARLSPKSISDILISSFPKDDEYIEKVEFVNGFLNFFLSKKFLYREIRRINNLGKEYGKANIGNGIKIQVEFVSANPTGPLHVGHGRHAAFGDSLSRLLKEAGFEVQKEYYVNDAGKQMEILGLSIKERAKELLGLPSSFPEDGYKGTYIIDIAKEIIDKYGESVIEKDVEFFKSYGLNRILENIKNDLSDFGVEFDNWFSEKTLYENHVLDKVIEYLKEKGLTYEKDGALWLKTTQFGDDKDRVLVRSNGIPTYFAGDLAYHYDKLKRGFDRVIDIWGADHHGYVKRMKAGTTALGYPEDGFEALLVQFVSLIKEGKNIGMSTRAGEFVTLRELIDEVGKDVARFYYVSKSADSHLEFDLDKAKQETRDNPMYYMQYAYARLSSIFEKAKERGFSLSEKDPDLTLLLHEDEIRLMKILLKYPEVIKKAAKHYAVHILINYLQDLASAFHKFYTSCRVLGEDKELSFARLSLGNATKIILNKALTLVGVTALEKM